MAWYKSVSPKWRRRVLILGGIFAIYSLTGFLFAPRILKSQLEKRLPALTQRKAAVRQVKLNPWALSLTIRGLELTEPDGRRFAAWEELYVNFQLSSLFRWAWTFKEIRLQQPFAEVLLEKDGRLNFANLFEREEAASVQPAKAGGEMPRLKVFLLSVTNGFVAFEDRTRRSPFRTEYRPINLRLTELSTQPGSATPYSFRAENDTGKRLSWAGDITLNPVGSCGFIEVIGADLTKYQPYLEDFTRAEIAGGKADIKAAYLFSAGTNGIDLVVSNGTVQLREFRVRDAEANETVLSVPELSVTGGAANLRERRAQVERVAVINPQGVVRINPDGSINLLRLQQPQSAASTTNAPPPGAPWTVAVTEFQLEGAALAFDDLSRKTPFRTLLKPVELSIKQFTTAPHSPAQYDYSITTEAAEQITGNGAFSVNPPQSSGAVQVAAVELKKYWPYLEDRLRGAIQAGKLDLEGTYQARWNTTAPQAAVSNLNVRVTGLKVRTPEREETVLELPELAIEEASADLGTRAARVKQVRVSHAAVVARRNADASINLLALLPPATAPAETNSAPAAPQAGATPPNPWTVAVDAVRIESCRVAWEDRATPAPAAITLDPITVELRNVTTSSNEPVAVGASVGVNGGGCLALNGEVRPWQRRAGLNLGITNLALQPFQPYLQQHARLGINSGGFELHGHLDWQEAEAQAPRLAFRGGLQLTNLLATDLAAQEFVRWSQLQVSGIHYTMQPDSVQVAAVHWDGLKTSLRIGPDKQINLLSVFPKRDTNAASMPTSPTAPGKAGGGTAGGPFPVRLDVFTLTNLAFHFADASIQPNCVFDIQEFGGVIRGLSSDPAASAEVALSGRVDERAPFAIQGRVNPLSPSPMLNLSISNSNLQLPVFTPYMEKYGGFPLNKGRLSLNLRYEIQDKALKAENKFLIDQLMLGPRNNSPDATPLPLKLAVALLKDRNGLIELDVPVSGRLDDPQFRLGPIILKVVINVITKAAASPFKLLGALVGGGEELSYLEFQPGAAAFVEGETNKLAKLVKALVERPALNLEIEALADPKADGDALARQAVRARLKERRIEEITASGQPRPPAETFEVEPEDYERLLRAALVEEFGTNLSSALHEFAAAASSPTNRPPAAAKVEKSRQSWLQAAIGWLPLHGKNSPQAIARRRAKADAEILKRNPELAATGVETMEALLASRTKVSPEEFLRLIRERSQVVQQYLTATGEITAERLFLIAPKPLQPGQAGQARVTLSLN